MEANGKIGSIINGLDGNSLQQLNAMQTDFDTVFQNGGNANNFGTGVAAASALISGQIVQQMISVITKEVTQYLALKIQSLALNTADITGAAGQLVAKYTMTISDIQNELLKDASKEMEDMSDISGSAVKNMTETASNQISGLIDNLKKKVSDKIDVGKITEKVNSIMNYAAQGPVWVDSQLIALATMIIKSIQKEIDNSTKSIEDQKKQLVDKMASSIAMNKAEEVNNKLKQQVRKLLNDTNRAKKNGEIKAATSARAAAIQILALVGL